MESAKEEWENGPGAVGTRSSKTCSTLDLVLNRFQENFWRGIKRSRSSGAAISAIMDRPCSFHFNTSPSRFNEKFLNSFFVPTQRYFFISSSAEKNAAQYTIFFVTRNLRFSYFCGRKQFEVAPVSFQSSAGRPCCNGSRRYNSLN